MKKDPLGVAIVVTLILALGGIVWMTRHPDSELLARAAGWPVVGELVESFRARYVPEPPQQEAAPDQLAEPLWTGATVEERGIEQGESESLARVWVTGGTVIRRSPDMKASSVAVTHRISRLPVLEQDGDWYRVLDRGHIGWIHLPDYGRDDEPPLGREPAAPGPLAGRPPDPELLSLARGLLQTESGAARLAEYSLFTDHPDPALVRVLDQVVRQLEPVYSRRYGVEPGDRPREAVVLFSRERDYRRLQNRLERLAGLPAVGLVSRGVVAVFVGDRESGEVAATVIHELAHLLNRRALGPALPAWLDEGLADDLSNSSISPAGQLDAETLGGSYRSEGRIWTWSGGRAAAIELNRALTSGRAPPLPELLNLDWEAFVAADHRDHYSQSAFLVRFLVAPDSGLREEMLAYLQGIRRGESVSPETLLGHLGLTWEELEDGFRQWFSSGLPDLVAETPRASGEPRPRE